MILDSSAIIAVLRAEPEAADFAPAIEAAECHVSAVSYVEAAAVSDSAGDAAKAADSTIFFAPPGLWWSP